MERGGRLRPRSRQPNDRANPNSLPACRSRAQFGNLLNHPQYIPGSDPGQGLENTVMPSPSFKLHSSSLTDRRKCWLL